MARMTKTYTVRIIDDGRSGRIQYAEGLLHSHEFYWEFGGGDVVVSINVPTPSEWPSALPWAEGRRTEVLERIAAVACRERCRGCRPVVTDSWIELRQ